MKTNYHCLCAAFLTAVVLVLLFSSFAHADYIYVANYGSGTIQEFDSSGNRSTFTSGLSRPTGLAFDSSGYLYATFPDDGTIKKFDSNRNWSTFASGMDYPWGIAVIPEPATLSLLAFGGLALLRRRRKK